MRYNTAAAAKRNGDVSGDVDKASQDAINQKIQAVTQDGQKVADEITLNVSKINEILLPLLGEKKKKQELVRDSIRLKVTQTCQTL